MANIRDVARLAKCSTATVSRFFNQKYVSADAERRIMTAIEKLAFSPNIVARNLKLKRSTIVGMIIPDITEPFFAAVVKGVEDIVRAKQYSLMLVNTQENEEYESRGVDMLLGRQCEGILLIKAPPSPLHERYRVKLATLPLPIVYLDRTPDAHRDAVLVDNVNGARRGIQHLLKLGHRKIAIVMMAHDVSSHLQRLDGYRRALQEVGVESRPEYIQQTDATVNGAYSATLQLLTAVDPPTAIFATNARLTIGAVSAIQSLGLRCPEDVSVLGHDGFDWQSVFAPRLTIVDQPSYAMGQKAAQLLFDRITGVLRGEPRRVVLNPELIIRESCGVYGGMAVVPDPIRRAAGAR